VHRIQRPLHPKLCSPENVKLIQSCSDLAPYSGSILTNCYNIDIERGKFRLDRTRFGRKQTLVLIEIMKASIENAFILSDINKNYCSIIIIILIWCLIELVCYQTTLIYVCVQNPDIFLARSQKFRNKWSINHKVGSVKYAKKLEKKSPIRR
jgi:hypothetical protein